VKRSSIKWQGSLRAKKKKFNGGIARADYKSACSEWSKKAAGKK
jgi:hypothetical protein